MELITPPNRLIEAGHLTIETVREDATETLRLVGELDLATAPALEAELARCEESDAECIVLDLTELDFLESAGLRVLLSAVLRSTSNGNRLTLTKPNSKIERTLTLVGVMDRLPFAA